MMKFYWVRALFTVSVRCPVHTTVRTPMYGLPLSQSDQRIRSVFQSVYNNVLYHLLSEKHVTVVLLCMDGFLNHENLYKLRGV